MLRNGCKALERRHAALSNRIVSVVGDPKHGGITDIFWIQETPG
jgi:hypothetical protein